MHLHFHISQTLLEYLLTFQLDTRDTQTYLPAQLKKQPSLYQRHERTSGWSEFTPVFLVRFMLLDL